MIEEYTNDSSIGTLMVFVDVILWLQWRFLVKWSNMTNKFVIYYKRPYQEGPIGQITFFFNMSCTMSFYLYLDFTEFRSSSVWDGWKQTIWIIEKFKGHWGQSQCILPTVIIIMCIIFHIASSTGYYIYFHVYHRSNWPFSHIYVL